MTVLSVHYAYRPPRIGWIIQNDPKELQRAMELSHMLFGGRFNPILPANDPALVDNLISLFELDLLWPVSEADSSLSLAQRYPYLEWPTLHSGPFATRKLQGSTAAHFVDVSHAIAHIRPQNEDERDKCSHWASQVTWDADDALAHVFMATFGAYSDPDHGSSYREMFELALTRRTVVLTNNDIVSADLAQLVTPSSVTIQGLQRTRYAGYELPGVYIGDASDIHDCMTYWNLRAAGIQLVFFDPAQRERLAPFVTARLNILAHERQSLGRGADIGYWSRGGDSTAPAALGERAWMRCSASPVAWNGLNIRPAQYAVEGTSSLANVEEEGDQVRLTFETRFHSAVDDRLAVHGQMAVLSLRRLALHTRDDVTLAIPFLPELNQFYSRAVSPGFDQIRAEPDGFGMFVSLSQSHVTIQSIRARA